MDEKTQAVIAISIIAIIVAVTAGLYYYKPATNIITPTDNGTTPVDNGTIVNPPPVVINGTDNGTIVTPPTTNNTDNGTVIVTPPVDNGTVIVTPPVDNGTVIVVPPTDNGTVIVNPPIINNTDNGTIIINPPEPKPCNITIEQPPNNEGEKPLPDEKTLPYVDNGTDICITDTDPSS